MATLLDITGLRASFNASLTKDDRVDLLLASHEALAEKVDELIGEINSLAAPVAPTTPPSPVTVTTPPAA